jgi:hypothetical protein
MENKCVVFLPGSQAYDTLYGYDKQLVDLLKQFFAEQGIAVQDMLFEEKRYTEKVLEANNMLNGMEAQEQRLKCMLYFMK